MKMHVEAEEDEHARQTDTKRILALFALLGVGLLGWAGRQFADLPSEVNTLKVQRVEDVGRLNRMDEKLDKILFAVKKH